MEDLSDVEDPEEWADSCLTSLSETSSNWYEPDLTCSICATGAATVGDLCQICWNWERAIDKVMGEHWQTYHCGHLGKTKEFPIIISDDEDE